jgi:putative PIN family toxin of toxin-antitoxin system
MYKIVLDTNIFISAILFDGKPEAIIKLCQERRIEIIISEAIISEISDVLGRKFYWEEWKIERVISDIMEFTKVITTRKSVSLIKGDPSDNRILECAFEGNAQYIISGDKKHLLPLKEFCGIEILTPNEFLDIYRGEMNDT